MPPRDLATRPIPRNWDATPCPRETDIANMKDFDKTLASGKEHHVSERLVEQTERARVGTRPGG